MLKRTLFLCFAFCTLLLSACKDDCEAPPVNENIVGEWTVSSGGNEGDVEFKADGTLIDPDDSLLGPGDEKSWVITGDNLDITAVDVGQTLTVTFNIVDNECDEIEVGVLGINATMKRK